MIEKLMTMLRELLMDLFLSFTAYALVKQIEDLQERLVRLRAEMFFANEHHPYVN